MFFLHRFKRWWSDLGRPVFRFHDGTRWRRADPFVAGAKLEEVCANYQDLLKLLAKKLDDPSIPVGPIRENLLEQKKQAAKTLVEATRKVFDLAPLTDEGGVTEGEVIRILAEFFVFMEESATLAGPFVT